MMDVVTILALAALGALQNSSPPTNEKSLSGYVEPAAQDPDRPPLPPADLKALRDSNIFSPANVVRREVKAGAGSLLSKEPSKPAPPVVTGIILDPKARVYQAVVEDRNKNEKLKLFKDPLFLKAGEEVLVYRIEEVTAELVVVSFGETRKELKVGESFPDAGLKSPEGAEGSEESAEAPVEGKPEPKSESKSDSKSEKKPEIKASDSSTLGSQEEERRRKVIEGMRKRKNRDYGP